MPELTTTQAVAGFLTPAAIFVILLALHLVLPAYRVEGYAHRNLGAAPPRYRLNGLAVFLCALLIWSLGLTAAPRDWLWAVKWHAIAGAVALSAAVTAWTVLRAPPDDRSRLAQWLEGRAYNARLAGHADTKMFLYIFGGAYLALNAVSSAAYHFGQYGAASNAGLFLHSAMWVWFITDYFLFERVQLFTFDIFEERLGFKLIAGCIVVYPLLYPVALWGTAGLPAPGIDPSLNVVWLGGSAAVFLIGWMISRGANSQKYMFKRAPDQAFLGLIEPATLTDGKRTLLCSGFWGASRHMNYFGEILEALGMALALGHFTSFWAWIYFIYLTVFFVSRERIDERRCAAKYGDLWRQYREKVPRRLVPGVY